MKSLLLMRHSYAVGNNPAFSDYERPLSDRGRDVATVTAGQLRSFEIDRIICSSAKRAHETAEIISQTLQLSDPESVDELYHAAPDTYCEAAVAAADDDDSTILVVGHNPGIASLMATWSRLPFSVTPGTAARFESSADAWQDFGAESRKLTDLIVDGQQRPLPQ